MSVWNNVDDLANWLRDSWSAVKNYGDNADPTGMAGYAVDPVTVKNMQNEGFLNEDLSINPDFQPNDNPRLIWNREHGLPEDYDSRDWLEEQIFGPESPGESPGGGNPGRGRGGSGYGRMQDAMDLVDATAKYNNEWSAQQAQLQRDWQERMARNAHLYETQDLQNAGLNPVLSAGGNGAATPSGAMGQTDTSNTRMMGELASSAISNLGLAAISGSSSGGKGLLGWLEKNSRAIGTLNGMVRSAAMMIRAVKGRSFRYY